MTTFHCWWGTRTPSQFLAPAANISSPLGSSCWPGHRTWRLEVATAQLSGKLEPRQAGSNAWWELTAVWLKWNWSLRSRPSQVKENRMEVLKCETKNWTLGNFLIIKIIKGYLSFRGLLQIWLFEFYCWTIPI